MEAILQFKGVSPGLIGRTTWFAPQRGPMLSYPSKLLGRARFMHNLERIANMGKDAVEIRKEFHARLGQMARELANELYPDGLPRGTKFSELEAVAGASGDEMARQLIEINVREQADDWPEQELGECPLCGGAARKAPDEPRVLTTTRGDVAWKQRLANCPRCRRAFSPSESRAGR